MKPKHILPLGARWLFWHGLMFLLCTGCGALIPQQRTENASIKTTEAISAAHDQAVEKIIEGEKTPVPVVTPPPNITVTGSSNTVNYSPDSGRLIRPVEYLESLRPPSAYRSSTTINSTSTQGGNSTEDASSMMKKKIPLWVALIGGGIGILILTFAIRYALRAIKSSASGAAALKVADTGIASVIQTIEAHASSSTDAAHTARLQNLAKQLEATRGKAASAAP